MAFPASLRGAARSHDDQERGEIIALLGPTNTGKTHYAIERMLAHPSGVIGLPLRLLAREVYDKVVEAKGAEAAALITGEEKIAPEGARYFVCTVEAMPMSRRFPFVAVDEIQIARDPERGHVFTDRILHARGEAETLLLGSAAMRPMIRKLVPTARFEARERFSTLSYAGPKKLTKLPRRTAVVAFSADQVYAAAELIKRQRGGAAIVMGALSPRTRNAQVELYQSGDVDFIVATDAIGMGVNMDVDHVAFAGRSKFDGQRRRALRADELGQIAGRAGRFRTDGAFGETGECTPFEPDIIRRIEEHDYENVASIVWRSSDLDFGSLGALIASLETPSPMKALERVRHAEDEAALKALAEERDIKAMAASRDGVHRLWEVCQLPDFRRVTIDQHVQLIRSIYQKLMSAGGVLPDDWVAGHLDGLDNDAGEVDTLASRLAHVRTWAYAANRPDWLAQPDQWRERARAIEDRLSDALHERLAQRFVDRRTSALLKGLKDKEFLEAEVNEDGEVTVAGHYAGRLQGLSFLLDPRAATGLEAKSLRNAALRALKPQLNARVLELLEAPDDAFSLADDGRILWRGAAAAKLQPADDPLRPRMKLMAGDQLEGEASVRALAKLEAWLAAQMDLHLAPLVKVGRAQAGEELKGPAKGLAFQLIESHGAVDRRQAGEQVKEIDQAQRQILRRLGVRFGEYSIYLPDLLKPKSMRMLSILRAAAAGKALDEMFLPPAGLTSVVNDKSRPWAEYAAVGFRPCGPRAVRLDMLEKFADAVREARGKAGKEGFETTHSMTGLLGCSRTDLEGVLQALGYRKKTIMAPARPAPVEPVQAAGKGARKQGGKGSERGSEKGAEAIEKAIESAGVSETAQSILSAWAGLEPPASRPVPADAPAEAIAEAAAAPGAPKTSDETSDQTPAETASEAARETAGEAQGETQAEPAEAKAEPASETGGAPDGGADGDAPKAAADEELVEKTVWFRAPPRAPRPHRQDRGERGERSDQGERRERPSHQSGQHEGRERDRERRRDGDGDGGKGRRPPWRDAPDRGRKGKPQGKGGPRGERGDREPRVWTAAPPDRGGKGKSSGPDPDSPFAALAALKLGRGSDDGGSEDQS